MAGTRPATTLAASSAGMPTLLLLLIVMTGLLSSVFWTSVFWTSGLLSHDFGLPLIVMTGLLSSGLLDFWTSNNFRLQSTVFRLR